MELDDFHHQNLQEILQEIPKDQFLQLHHLQLMLLCLNLQKLNLNLDCLLGHNYQNKKRVYLLLPHLLEQDNP
tara:strand:+ start:306 stop:524 length:219 start_codon:yes stop_codon:yes gene_type:complete